MGAVHDFLSRDKNKLVSTKNSMRNSSSIGMWHRISPASSDLSCVWALLDQTQFVTLLAWLLTTTPEGALVVRLQSKIYTPTSAIPRYTSNKIVTAIKFPFPITINCLLS